MMSFRMHLVTKDQLKARTASLQGRDPTKRRDPAASNELLRARIMFLRQAVSQSRSRKA